MTVVLWSYGAQTTLLLHLSLQGSFGLYFNLGLIDGPSSHAHTQTHEYIPPEIIFCTSCCTVCDNAMKNQSINQFYAGFTGEVVGIKTGIK